MGPKCASIPRGAIVELIAKMPTIRKARVRYKDRDYIVPLCICWRLKGVRGWRK